MQTVIKAVLLAAAIAFVAGQAPCACVNVGNAPSCTGTASGVVFTVTCTIPSQGENNIFFAAQGLSDSHANPAWTSTNNVFSRPRVPSPAGFASVNCTNPTTPRFFAPSSQGWVYSYDEDSCEVTATLSFGPNNLPSSFLFDNESQATSVSQIPNYNVITVPIGIARTSQISTNQVIVSNTLFSFYARLPTALTADATRYALKLFKLSDNDREADTAFSAIVMGGLTSGPDRHVLTGTPVFIPDPSSPSLTCTIQAEIYVSCGPFVDTNSPSPVTVSGVLEVYAQCSTVGCIARKLTLPVSFLAGDYQSTLDGTWATLTPLIWRRLENNDTLDVELTNDVIVGGDKLILSLHFDAGSVSTLTKLFMTVTGFSGAGATLVEYSNGNANNVFVIEDTNILSPVHFASTIIYNQLQQSLIDSFFRFPNSYDINFAVQWDWPATLPTDFRGQVDVSSFFDIAYAVRRRQGDSNQYALIQAPQNSVGDVNADGVTTLVIDSASGLSVVSFIVAVLAILLL